MRRLIAVIGLLGAVSAGCIPEGQTESRVYVANRTGTAILGYNGCTAEDKILSVKVTDETGSLEDTIWKVEIETGPAVDDVALGIAPPGYRTVVPFQIVRVRKTKHLAVTIDGASGYSGGIAGDDFLSLRVGTLRWVQGVRTANDLSGIKKSTFGC